MMYIRYSSRKKLVEEGNPSITQIYEMTDDLSQERCVYSNGVLYSDDLNDFADVSIGQFVLWSKVYNVDVLTYYEAFLEAI